MLLIHGIIFIPFTIAFVIFQEPKFPQKWDGFAPPELYRLEKVLNPINIGSFYRFNLDFRYEAIRYNFSESSYADTCANFYLGMKWTLRELDNLRVDLPDMMGWSEGINRTDQLEDRWFELYPQTYLFVKRRRNVIDQLSAKAKPQTTRFIREILNEFDIFSIALLKKQVKKFKDTWESMEESLNLFKEYLFALLTEEDSAVASTIKRSLTKLAGTFRNLSTETKIDLQQSMCIRNALKWLNNDVNGAFDQYFDLFSEKLDLNIDELLKENEYLSNLHYDEVKEKFKKRANEYDIPEQEYVDNCAKMYSIMKLNEMEKADFNQSTDHFMGKEWGRKKYDNFDEFWSVLLNESSPFINILSKRLDFIKHRSITYRSTTIIFQSLLNTEQQLFLKGLHRANNVIAAKPEKRKNLDGNFLVELGWINHRPLEQIFCMRSTLESFLEREISLEEIDT